jgi:hypothetical protein
LFFTGDTNTGLFSPGADTVALATAGSNRLHITSGGLVGIGSTSPTQQLHVKTDQAAYTWARIDNQSSSASAYSGLQLGAFGNSWGLAIGSSAANSNSLTFVTDAGGTNSEKARFTSDGKFLVGTSSERTNVYYTTVATTPKVQFETTVNSYSNGLSLINYSASGFSSVLTLGLSASNTQGTNTAIASTHEMGTINFVGNDGTNFRTGASIVAVNDQLSAWAVGDCPTRLVFSVTADGASSPTERMRIGSDGRINMFAGSGSSLEVANSNAAGTTNYIMIGRHSSIAINGGTTSYVVYTNGNVQNSNNSYGAISDIKLKENIVDANSQWDDLKALQVRNYNFKEGQTHTQIGLVAQEVELVSPGLVSESPDRDEEGNDLGTVTKSVNYSVLYMKAVKALQEAMERIEALEADVAALKGA